MPTRSLRDIPEELKRHERELLTAHIITINDAMDAYRRQAAASFRDLEHLSDQIGDPDLYVGRSIWHSICVGRAGIPQHPSPQAQLAFAYLLGLDLDDLGIDPTVHRAMAGALDRLKRSRVAA